MPISLVVVAMHVYSYVARYNGRAGVVMATDVNFK